MYLKISDILYFRNSYSEAWGIFKLILFCISINYKNSHDNWTIVLVEPSLTYLMMFGPSASTRPYRIRALYFVFLVMY